MFERARRGVSPVFVLVVQRLLVVLPNDLFIMRVVRFATDEYGLLTTMANRIRGASCLFRFRPTCIESLQSVVEFS